MPRTIPISPENFEWLRANHARTSQTKIAKRLGMCIDTLKRVLMREGLQWY